MRIRDAINAVDDVKPNQYSDETKIRWLSYLDGTIKREVIDTHEEGEGVFFEPYTAKDIDRSLLAEYPYDELYVAYLKMKIDDENGEAARYNNSSAMFNSLLYEYKAAYNREHRPIPARFGVYSGGKPYKLPEECGNKDNAEEG